MDTPAPTTDARPSGEQTTDRPWPALAALATAGVLPSITARKTTHVSLTSAFVVHLLAVVATAVVGALVFQWVDHARNAMTFIDVWEECLVDLGDLRRQFQHYPLQMTLAVVLVIVGVEAAYLLTALISIAWGALEEPVRASFRNALQRTWLHTSHILLLTLLCGTAYGYLQRAHLEAASRVSDEYVAKVQTLVRAAESSAQGAHVSASNVDQILEEAWSRYPSYVRYGEAVAAILLFAGGVWWQWAFLRFIGAPRPFTPTARPPECESCGYNLTGIPLDGLCPECGGQVAISLGPGVRPGSPWQQRRTLGLARAWWHCLSGAVWHSARFGRQLRVRLAGTDHRWYLALHLPIVFIVAWAGLLGFYAADSGKSPFADRQFAWQVVPVAAALTSVVVLTVALAAAAVRGVVYRLKAGRNLMAASMQAACYLGGYFVGWVCLASLWGMALVIDKSALDALGQELGIDRYLAFSLL